MASEDSGNPPLSASTPILPHYPELILAAIEALDPKNGANKSKISKQIEASYGNLPGAHKTLLSHHLNKMRASGELVVIKNNYVKPDPDSPPPRGRGRPPKPKQPLPEGAVISPPRPRGRPRKDYDPSNPVTPVSSTKTPAVSGRKRGRPRKYENTPTASPAPGTATGESRGRGRPPKVKPADAPVTESGEKRGRGRPPKVKTGDSPAPAKAAVTETGEKRGRGRPRKEVTEAAPEGV